jgi:hypothetical protein
MLRKWRDLISDNQQPGSHFPFEFSATTRGTSSSSFLLLRITPPTTPAFTGLCLVLEALTVLRGDMLKVGVPSSDCRTPQLSPDCGFAGGPPNGISPTSRLVSITSTADHRCESRAVQNLMIVRSTDYTKGQHIFTLASSTTSV